MIDTWQRAIKFKLDELSFYGSFEIAMEAYERGETLPGAPGAFNWEINVFLHETMPKSIKKIDDWLQKAGLSLCATIEALITHDDYPNTEIHKPEYLIRGLETVEYLIKNCW